MPQRVPLPWLQLTHEKLRLLAAVAGIAFLLARSLRSVDGGFGDLTRAELNGALHPADASAPAADSPGRLAVLEDGDGQWRWRYVEQLDGARPVSLTANVTVHSEHEAVRAAGVAYPGVPATPAYLAELDRIERDDPAALRPNALHRLVAAVLVPVMSVVRRRSRP